MEWKLVHFEAERAERDLSNLIYLSFKGKKGINPPEKQEIVRALSAFDIYPRQRYRKHGIIRSPCQFFEPKDLRTWLWAYLLWNESREEKQTS